MAARARTSILEFETVSDDLLARYSQWSDIGYSNPRRVGRKLIQVAGVLTASLVVLGTAIGIVGLGGAVGFSVSEEGRMMVALVALLSAVVFLAALGALVVNVLQALIYQHIALSEGALENMEAEEDRREAMEELAMVRTTLEAAHEDGSPDRLREAVRKALQVINRSDEPPSDYEASYESYGGR